jgi:hypothetical protein
MNSRLGLILGTATGMSVLLLSLGPIAESGPTVEEPTEQASTVTYIDGQFVMAPLPDGYSAAVTVDQALAVAEKMHQGEYDQVTKVTPTLALYSNTNVVEVDSGKRLIENVPAWVITIEGLCATFWGGFSPQDDKGVQESCVPQTRHVVIDAESGEFIEDWGG